MKPLYTQDEFNQAKTRDFLSVECYQCGNPYQVKKRYIKSFLTDPNSLSSNKYCSKKCLNKSKLRRVEVECKNCSTKLEKRISVYNKSKTKRFFCNQSCAATYNNRNKTHGTRRSKLEVWLEERLKQLYPHMKMLFNSKEAIGSELDIYIPSLNLAIELNGIFHYEPIFGVDKLQQIQENDKSKTLACYEAKIDLCIIDTSGQKYFKPKSSQKYLDIIIKIIETRK